MPSNQALFKTENPDVAAERVEMSISRMTLDGRIGPA
jgi:hypothetical protein